MGAAQKRDRSIVHVDDMAATSLYVLDFPKQGYGAKAEPMLSHINVGTSLDISILKLAHLLARITGFNGEITTDPSKPDGSPRKLMDASRLETMGWRAHTGLEAGIAETYQWYLANVDNLRG